MERNDSQVGQSWTPDEGFQSYALDDTPLEFFKDDLFMDLSWLRGGSHSFWWHPIDDERYPIYIDLPLPPGSGWFGEMSKAFAVKGIPHSFVVDQQGQIVAHGRLEYILQTAMSLRTVDEVSD